MKTIISPILISMIYLLSGCGGSSSNSDNPSPPNNPNNPNNPSPDESLIINIEKEQLTPFELLDSNEIGIGEEIPDLDDIYFETENSLKLPAVTIDGKKILIPDIGQNENIKIKLVLEKNGEKLSSKFIPIEKNPYDFSVEEEDTGKPTRAFLSAYLDNVRSSIAFLDGIDPQDDYYQLLLAQEDYLENFIAAVDFIQAGEEKVQVTSPYLNDKISFELKKEDLAVYDQLAIQQTMITEQIDTYYENKNNLANTQTILAAANTSTSKPCKVNKFVIEKGKKIPYGDWIFKRNVHANASIDAVTNAVYAGFAVFSKFDEVAFYIKFLVPPSAVLVTELQFVLNGLSLITQISALTTKLAIASRFNSDDGIEFEANMVEISRLATKIMTKAAADQFKKFLTEKLKTVLANPDSAKDIIDSLDFIRRSVGDYTGANKLIDNMIAKFRAKLEGLVKENLTLHFEQQCDAGITTIPYTGTYTRIPECPDLVREKKTVSGIMTSSLEDGETKYFLRTEEMSNFQTVALTFSLPGSIPEKTIHTFTYPDVGKPYDGTEVFLTTSFEMGLNSAVYKHRLFFVRKPIPPIFCNISWTQTFKYTLPYTTKKN